MPSVLRERRMPPPSPGGGLMEEAVFSGGVSRQYAASQAVPSVLSPSRPAGASVRSDFVPMAEHRRAVDDLLAMHDAEVRRSDIVHARYVAGLQRALEEARSERDGAQEDGVDLEERLLAAERRRARLRRALRRAEDRNAEERRELRAEGCARKGAAELQVEAAHLREEIARLRQEKDEAGEAARQEEAEARQRLSALHSEYAAACDQHDDLVARLDDGTADYRALEARYRDGEAQALQCKQSFLQLQQKLRRRDQVRQGVLRQAEQAVELHREAAQRAAQRTARAATPLDPLLGDLRELGEALRGIAEQLQRL
eukprot:TRINITY_DN2729_c0_g2_i1.p3 TRINITY_DN2729_c0_g2~~TRINITY_DN2729_c0_g2_i1.p3  ORF type:complete len:336 (+),score=150.66 TRINITY_DN2729_c0_g2_i1:69-1010(+)